MASQRDVRKEIREFERCCTVVIEMLDSLDDLSTQERMVLEEHLTSLMSALMRWERARGKKN